MHCVRLRTLDWWKFEKSPTEMGRKEIPIISTDTHIWRFSQLIFQPNNMIKINWPKCHRFYWKYISTESRWKAAIRSSMWNKCKRSTTTFDSTVIIIASSHNCRLKAPSSTIDFYIFIFAPSPNMTKARWHKLWQNLSRRAASSVISLFIRTYLGIFAGMR